MPHLIKKTLFALALMTAMAFGCGGLKAQAPGGQNIVVSRNDGGATSEIPVASDTKITFDATTMIVTQGENTFSFPLATIQKIEFALKTSSTDDIAKDLGADFKISVQSGIVTLTPAPGAALPYAAADLKGRLIAIGQTKEEITIDFGTQPAGVYIIKAGDKTIKFTNR